MFCGNCGAELTAQTNFCPYCGTALQSTTTSISLLNKAASTAKSTNEYNLVLVSIGSCNATMAGDLLEDVFGYTDAESGNLVRMVPVVVGENLTAEEAAQYINFAVPEGAENVVYRLLNVEGQEPLAEVQFDLDGRSFNMREQRGVAATEDISGMYYDWTVQDGANVWGSIPGSAYRFIGDGETADLLTWYIEEIETSYALSVVAPDLDGFDIIAVVNMMAPQ